MLDPALHRTLREHMVPVLRTWASVRVWTVGARIGELGATVLVALAEARLLGKARVYATHADEAVVDALARGGIDCADPAAARASYRAGGGELGLDEHCQLGGGQARLRPDLVARLSVFAHDWRQGGSLNEFQLVVSGEPLSALSPSENARFFELAHASLCRHGMLVVGEGDSLALHPWRKAYQPVIDGSERFWRRLR